MTTGASGAFAQDVTPGPHTVGLRIVSVIDTTRRTPGSEGMDRTVWIWYPAEESDRPTLGYADLFALEYDGGVGDWLYAEPVQFGADSMSLRAILDLPSRSVRDAPATALPAPLVVMAQGYGHPAFVNLGTNELLASHGYIVAATSFDWPQGGLDETDNQVRDISIAIETVRGEMPAFDGENIGIVGHSAGGLAAPIAAARRADIDALVLLDAGVLSKDGAARMREELGERPGLRIPTVLAQSRWWRLGEEPHPNFDAGVMNLFAGPRVTMDLRYMEHPDFVSLDHLRSETLDYEQFGVAYDFEEAGHGLASIQRTILHLFDWVFADSDEALAALERGPAGAAEELVYTFDARR